MNCRASMVFCKGWKAQSFCGTMVAVYYVGCVDGRPNPTCLMVFEDGRPNPLMELVLYNLRINTKQQWPSVSTHAYTKHNPLK